MTSPFLLPSNFSQTVIANRSNQNALVPGLNSGHWDMMDSNRTGRWPPFALAARVPLSGGEGMFKVC